MQKRQPDKIANALKCAIAHGQLGPESDRILFFTDETSPSWLSWMTRALEHTTGAKHVMHGDALVRRVAPAKLRNDNYWIYQVGLYLQERAAKDYVWGDDEQCGPCARSVERDRSLLIPDWCGRGRGGPAEPELVGK